MHRRMIWLVQQSNPSKRLLHLMAFILVLIHRQRTTLLSLFSRLRSILWRLSPISRRHYLRLVRSAELVKIRLLALVQNFGFNPQLPSHRPVLLCRPVQTGGRSKPKLVNRQPILVLLLRRFWFRLLLPLVLPRRFRLLRFTDSFRLRLPIRRQLLTPIPRPIHRSFLQALRPIRIHHSFLQRRRLIHTLLKLRLQPLIHILLKFQFQPLRPIHILLEFQPLIHILTLTPIHHLHLRPILTRLHLSSDILTLRLLHRLPIPLRRLHLDILHPVRSRHLLLAQLGVQLLLSHLPLRLPQRFHLSPAAQLNSQYLTVRH